MAQAGPSAPPFRGLKVIELSQDPGGEMAGRYLADLGAEVIKVEPPEGAGSRRVGPFAYGRTDAEHSLNFWFYNANKKSVTADLATPAGMAQVRSLLSDAAVLVVSYQPKHLGPLGLDYDELQRAFPKLIILSVTPYGLTGPWADYLSTDLIAFAGGGQLHISGYDDHSIPPMRPGGNQAYHTAATFALAGAEVALLQRQADGLGQLVDVSMHDCLAVTVEMAFAYWEYQQAPVRRQTCRHAQPMITHCALFECADGRYIYSVVRLADQKPFKALISWMAEEGMAAGLDDEKYLNPQYRQEHFYEIQTVLECFYLTKTADEVFKGGQDRLIPIGALYGPEDLPADEHLAARGFWKTAEGEEGPITYPGAPYVFSAFAMAKRVRAPRLGEHNP